MKPFDYTTALLGRPVITNEGRRVNEILSTDQRNYLIGLIDGIHYPVLFDYSGKVLDTSGTGFKTEMHSITGLFMAPVKKKGWCKLYQFKTGTYHTGQYVTTRDEADLSDQTTPEDCTYVGVVEFEWEE